MLRVQSSMFKGKRVQMLRVQSSMFKGSRVQILRVQRFKSLKGLFSISLLSIFYFSRFKFNQSSSTLAPPGFGVTRKLKLQVPSPKFQVSNSKSAIGHFPIAFRHVAPSLFAPSPLLFPREPRNKRTRSSHIFLVTRLSCV